MRRQVSLVFGAVVCLSLALSLGPAPAASARSAGGGGPLAGTTVVEYWGTVFTTGAHAGTATPVAVSLPDSVVQVASSNSTDYALLSDGAVYAWGYGDRGELGDGSTANSLGIPVRVQFPSGVSIAFLANDAMPYDAGLAVDTAGNAWGWGADGNGELCLGKRLSAVLKPIELPLHDVTALAGANDHAIFDASGKVVACGSNTDGDLGDGSTAPSDTPVLVSGLQGASVTALVAAWADSGALLQDGTYYDWGYDADGQLGDGQMGVNSDTPVEVDLPHPAVAVAEGGSRLGNGQTLAILSDRSLWAWGADSNGQLGDGRTANEDVPEGIKRPTGVRYVALATAGQTSYALSGARSLYAWGGGQSGEIGDGKTVDQPQPVLVLSGVTQLSSTAENVVTR